MRRFRSRVAATDLEAAADEEAASRAEELRVASLGQRSGVNDHGTMDLVAPRLPAEDVAQSKRPAPANERRLR
jgi:hypothetical protein